MIIAIGADHRGFELKEEIKKRLYLADTPIKWDDVGAFDAVRSDYPIFAQAVVHELLHKKADVGILLCGSGAGMAIAANRFAHIYAGLAWNVETAISAKEDDNVNVLIIPSDYVDAQTALQMIQKWLTAQFKEERYRQRIDQIDKT